LLVAEKLLPFRNGKNGLPVFGSGFLFNFSLFFYVCGLEKIIQC